MRVVDSLTNYQICNTIQYLKKRANRINQGKDLIMNMTIRVLSTNYHFVFKIDKRLYYQIKICTKDELELTCNAVTLFLISY